MKKKPPTDDTPFQVRTIIEPTPRLFDVISPESAARLKELTLGGVRMFLDDGSTNPMF